MARAAEKKPISDDLELVLDGAGSAFERLRGSRLFITGGTGFIGRWLLESLALAEDRLMLGTSAAVLSRDPEEFKIKAPHLFNKPWLTFVKGDVRSFAFPEGRFTDIIHCATAASASMNAEAPLEMFDTIVTGTRRTLDFAARCGAERFLLASSGAVYGRQPPDMTHVAEDFTGGPVTTDTGSAYAEGKRAAEYLCTAYGAGHGLKVKIARGFAFVGPFLPLDTHFAIGNFIRDGLAGGPIIVKGDGTPYRSYMYASDMAVWMWKILADGGDGVPYNVGSEEAISVRELAFRVAGAFTPGCEVRVMKEPVPGSLAERYVPSVKRARKQLGAGIRVPLDEALRKTIAFHRTAS